MCEISYEEFMQLDSDSYVLIDIRDAIQTEYGMIKGAIYIDENEILDRADTFDKNKKIILYCARGVVSLDIAEQLREKGFDAYSFKGGYNSYIAESIRAFVK